MANLHAAGVASLTVGKWNDAVESLERAIETETRKTRASDAVSISVSAPLLNDICVAYMYRARQAPQPTDVFAALSAAERAVVVDVRSDEALYNRAAAAELAGVNDSAATDWQSFLDRDGTSSWAAEARQRQHKLRSRISTAKCRDLTADRLLADSLLAVETATIDCAAEVRAVAEDVIVPTAAAALASGDRNNPAVYRARVIGSELSKLNDQFVIDSMRRLNDSGGDELLAIARSLQEYRAARQYYSNGAIEPAERLFRSAYDTFQRIRFPYRVTAAGWVAGCRHYQGDFANSRRWAATALDIDSGRYPAAAARLYWLIALNDSVGQRPDAACTEYEEALKLFEISRDRESHIVVQDLLAEVYQEIGAVDLAWQTRGAAIARISTLGSIGRAAQVFGEAARAATASGYHAAALRFVSEYLRALKGKSNPLLTCDALAQRAIIRVRLGDASGALTDVDRAKRLADALPRGGPRERASAEVKLAETFVLPERSLEDATAASKGLIRYFRESNDGFGLAMALVEQGRVLVAQRSIPEAVTAYEQAVTLLEHENIHLPRTLVRAEFLDRYRTSYVELTSLLIATHHPIEAFAYAERLHLRSSEAMDDRKEARIPLTLGALQAKLPRSVLVLSYLVADRYTAIWAIRRDRWRVVIVPLGEATMGDAVKRFVDAVRSGGAADREARRLAALIFDPVQEESRDAAEVVVIPDGPVQNVAFAALRDPEGFFLTEKHAILYSPSASETFVAPSAVSPRRLLVVADPSLSENQRRRFPSLGGARVEAERVRALYDESEALIAGAATRTRVLDRIDAADVLHYAGHAAVDERKPPLSALLLAADRGADGVLYAYEIASRRLRRLRLAVLAGCGTAATRRASHDGITSVAHAFLKAGVRDVVASIWDIDDDISGEFLERFHRAYPKLGASEALRLAQLAYARNKEPRMRAPLNWAGFRVIGHIETR